MRHSADIAVAGSGLAGLTASLALASLGWRVINIAPASPREDRRTTALLAASTDLLRRHDVWAELEKQAAPLEVMRIVDATGRLIRAPQTEFHASEVGLDAFGYNVENAAIVRVLRNACLSHGVEFLEDSVTGLQHHEARILLETDGGHHVDASFCVASDGRNSAIRKLSGFGERSWRYKQTAIVMNFTHEHSNQNTSTEFHTANGPFTIVPLGENRSSLVWVDAPQAAADWAEKPASELALEVERRMDSMLGKVEIASPVQTWPLSGMVAKLFGRGPIALVGEAAHVFPPIGAQGFNLGIRDVELLTTLVADKAETAFADLGDVYHRRRTADIASRGMAIDLLNRSLLSGFLPLQIARSMGLSLLASVGPLRRLVMREGVAPGRQAKAILDRLRPTG